jgi:hypothetical protein
VSTAIAAVDQARPSPSIIVRLVAIPAFQTHCFLLEGPDVTEVFTIDCGQRLDIAPVGVFLPAAQFLARLASLRPTRGIYRA